MRAVAKWTISLSGLLLAGLTPAYAGGCEQPVGRLVSLQGVVEAHAVAETLWHAVQLNTTFCQGDTIRTAARSRAAVVLATETIVRLDQLTTLTLSGLTEKPTSWMDLLTGAAHFITRTPRALQIKTPYVNAAVEGTEFVVRVDQKHGSVTVLEGRVLAENAEGAVRMVSGQSAVANAAQPPVLRLGVRPDDAVQWSIYYPPLYDAKALSGSADWNEAARRSADAYLAGDMAGAFAAIEALPDGITDARFYNYRAGLLLAVGRLDQAQADIARSLNLAADNAHAEALQSVVALARNDKSTALSLARKANAHDGESVPAWIALSYAQQAAFDLDAAIASMQQALSRDPGNVLALARLSELWLSLGDLARAVDTANRAVAINPNIARTQTVLGFAYLTQIKTTEARQAFEKSISLDSADPLPRLGLGLALIRTGQLEAGRRDIEIAAALDPNNSLLRSYLGKAYYEEKRDRLVGPQLAMAKGLDPKDPTPWFYDAIRLQTENRPVEALNDLQKSIELNDNRAVYRSRLLLDEDLAARSASLGRIYNDLGFQQLALVQGWRSIDSDPSDYSGHRLLADNYAALPRHEIARVSELLKAQLLQPVNITPIQPQLAETSLAGAEGSGPVASGYNEYNPLFTRDRTALQLDGVTGSNNTRGGDVIVSGLYSGFSYSLGRFNYKSDGFRANNDQDQEISDAFVQAALSPDVSVQAEWRRRTVDNGDLALNFDPNNFSLLNRRNLRQDTDRFGLHYAPSHQSDVLVSWIAANQDASVRSVTPPVTIDEQTTNNGHQAEAQYLWRGARVNLTAGLGSYDIKVDTHFAYDWSALPPFFTPCPSPPLSVPCSDQQNRRRQHDMAYLYSNITYSQALIWTVGASYDALKDGALNLHEVNPKLGLQWSVAPDTQLRFAYLETVKRSLQVNQTIEPTQVAGFNQFFDEDNGTRAKLRGLGLDSVLSRGLYGGIEGTRRTAIVPQFNSNLVDFAEDAQRTYRGYLYWTPVLNWTFSAEVRSELIENRSHPTGPSSIDTIALPLAVRYFSPGGFFGRLAATHVRQIVDQLSISPIEATTDFFVVDAGVGYRFPRRHGTLSLEVRNLFDRTFSYQDLSFMSSDQVAPPYIPARQTYLRFGLNF